MLPGSVVSHELSTGQVEVQLNYVLGKKLEDVQALGAARREIDGLTCVNGARAACVVLCCVCGCCAVTCLALPPAIDGRAYACMHACMHGLYMCAARMSVCACVARSCVYLCEAPLGAQDWKWQRRRGASLRRTM